MKKLVLFLSIKLIAIILTSNQLLANSDWLDNYNVSWDSPSTSMTKNMPLVGGDIGCNVWVENGDLMFYVQRSGSFNEIGEYIKMGRIKLTLSPNPFKDSTVFEQQLILKDGYINISAIGKDDANFKTNIKLWVDRFTHSVNVEIDSQEPVDYKVDYQTWRTEDKSLVEPKENFITGKINTLRWGSFSFVLSPFEVIKLKDKCYKFDNNSVLFYHKNPKETLSPNYAIKQQGLEKYKDEITNVISNRITGGRLFATNAIEDKQGSGTYFKNKYKSLTLKSKEPNSKHNIFVATHIDQQENDDVWIDKLNEICKEISQTKGSFEQNKKWWNNFWQQSWIVITPNQKDEKNILWQIGRNYNLMRYKISGSSSGQYPVKFNGGSLTFDEPQGYDPDWRKWGGDFHTAQNQRLLYWQMLKSGDFDMMTPQFELYKKAHAGAKIRVKDAFGHSGAMFSENTDPSGMHIPFCYGYTEIRGQNRKDARGEDVPFGDERIKAINQPNQPIEKGIMLNNSVSYHFNSQLEISYMILQRYLFDGKSFQRYYELIKDSLVFFDQHYQARKIIRDGTPLDENGKLFITPAQAGEAHLNAINPSDIIAGLRACLETLLEIDQPYITNDDKQYYAQFLKRIPDYNIVEFNGKKVSVASVGHLPVGRVRKETPQMYALYPYQRFNLTDEQIKIFQHTWDIDVTMRLDPGGWNQNGIFLAHLGKTKDALDYHKLKLADTTRHEFPTYWRSGDGTPDINHGGSGMIGLQEMLMQTFDKKILLFPAWDKNIDVDFKLHAPYNTTVDVSLKNGKIQKLIVTPKSRQKDVILDFPFKQKHQ